MYRPLHDASSPPPLIHPSPTSTLPPAHLPPSPQPREEHGELADTFPSFRRTPRSGSGRDESGGGGAETPPRIPPAA
ncbi:uncharacterized protein SCHCODRAFT_02502688 [Schizophyllum commune H4-8]|nr:uncharacterized protein SCHCODRAFT_02502688 [Schizophyllum commune H4-8]KAI5892141.1 hypothetical protein SCHCODRAFT_02502688 [Schizophyllum commune H4-8]